MSTRHTLLSCVVCGQDLGPGSLRRKYCSPKCRNATRSGNHLDRSCLVCGEQIAPEKLARGAKYCSPRCRKVAYSTKYRVANQSEQKDHDVALPPNARAAMCELLVAADLMKRGYDVYRAMSPGSPCTIAFFYHDHFLRVQVKAVVRSATGHLMQPKVAGKAFDVLALVERSGEIHYQPALSALLN